MDRKLCVLVYSTYSAASKTLIEYVRALPYDLAAVTGMTLLCADSSAVRDALMAKDVKNVPCLILQYFDGRSQLLEDMDVYKFIASVSRSIGIKSQQENIPQENSLPDAPPMTVTEMASIVSRDKVMSAATEMQKSREVEEGPKRTQLLSN
jgi:hypothetical protein